jgi:hypothetical protein
MITGSNPSPVDVAEARGEAEIASSDELDRVFGQGPGTTPAERARVSERRFVRSQTALAAASQDCQGLQMSAHEAHAAFGWDVLRHVPDCCSVPIVRAGHEVMRVLPAARRAAGLSRVALSARAGVALGDIVTLEEGLRSLPMAVLVKLATALDLCPIRFGAVPCTGPLFTASRESPRP